MKKQFTEEEIRKKLDAIREAWIGKKGVWSEERKQQEFKDQQEARKFLSENTLYLKALQTQYPKKFEQFYWDNRIGVKRNGIKDEVIANRILPIVSLCVSVMAMASSILNSLPKVDDNCWWGKYIVAGIALVVGFVAIVMFVQYIFSVMNTRETSYYAILLSILEEMRENDKAFGETETEEMCGEAKINDRETSVEKKAEERSSEQPQKETASNKSEAEKKEEAPCTVQNAERN